MPVTGHLMLTYPVMSASVLSVLLSSSENFLPRSLFKLPIITPVRVAQSSNLQTKLGRQLLLCSRWQQVVPGGVVFVVLVILNTDIYCHVLPRLNQTSFSHSSECHSFTCVLPYKYLRTNIKYHVKRTLLLLGSVIECRVWPVSSRNNVS